MSSIGKIVFTLETQSEAFSKGTVKAGSDLDNFRKKCQATKEDVGGLRGALDKLKGGAGRGSTLDELGKTLKGAGAVAGITIIGEQLAKATGEAAKLSEQFRRGEIDGAGLAVGIGKSLPIIGGFVEAGQNIREMFTHEKAQIDDINETTKENTEIAEHRFKIIADTVNMVREYARVTAEANAKVAEFGMTAGAKKRFEIDFAFGEKQDDLKHKLDEQFKSIDDGVKAEREKIAPTLSALRTELSHSTEGSKEYKNLSSIISQLTGNMDGLGASAKEQKQKLTDAANSASYALERERQVAQASIVKDYLGELQKKLTDLDPDPIHKVTTELADLHATADQTRAAVDLLDKIKAAETYKTNAEGLKAWQKELDETGAKLAAVAGGADEHVAEMWSKLHTDDSGQRDQFAALAQQQVANDAALKSLEAQKQVKAEIAALTKEAAQVGMTEAQKKLDDLKRDGANAGQVAQAAALQQQVDKQTKAAELFKKDQEDAKKLIEESQTPLQKYQDQVKQIDDLYAKGLLTQQQALGALTKDATALDKHDQTDKHVGAETRRFDFTILKEPKHADVAAQQLQAAKAQLASTKKIENYQEQQYQWGLTAQQNQTQVATF
jgi:hypothetical protein